MANWLVGRDTHGARAVNAAFERQGFPVEQARRQVMLFFDNTLFCHDHDPYRLLGLTPECSVGDIHRRHKEMLQVFHPDRHSDGQNWFTDRSEQLNRAYAYLKVNRGRPGATSIPNQAMVTASPAPATTRRQPGPHFPDKDDLRRRLTSWLGKPSNLQQQVYLVLVTVPVVLLLLLYLNSTGPVDPPITSAATDTAPSSMRTPTAPETEAPVPADIAPESTADARDNPTAPRVLRVTHPDVSARPTEPAIQTTRPVIPLRVTHPDAGAAAERGALEARASGPEPPAPAAAPRNEEVPVAETDDIPSDLVSNRSDSPSALPDSAAREPTPDPESAPAEPNVHALLKAYESAYNRSDIDRFSGLFGDGARTKNAASKKEIRRKYGELFHRTEVRNLVLDEVRVRPIGEHQYEVSTRFAVEWTYPDGRTSSSSGRFSMHLVKVDGELEIWRLDY